MKIYRIRHNPQLSIVITFMCESVRICVYVDR